MGRPDWDWSRVHWDNMDASIDSIGRFIRGAQDRTNELLAKTYRPAFLKPCRT